MVKTKKLVLAAMFSAIGIILPFGFHAIPGAGGIILPMHIPILICGLTLGWPYGLACGALTPLLSSLFTSMPPMAILPGMLFELMAYGFVSGIMPKYIKINNEIIRLYLSLIIAMLCGRLVGGALNALIFRAGDYSLQMWLASSFATALPGIIIQLGCVPSISLAFEKTSAIKPASV